jgi:hypothetical protein
VVAVCRGRRGAVGRTLVSMRWRQRGIRAATSRGGDLGGGVGWRPAVAAWVGDDVEGGSRRSTEDADSGLATRLQVTVARRLRPVQAPLGGRMTVG